MASPAWERLIEKHGSEEAARAAAAIYKRDQRRGKGRQPYDKTGKKKNIFSYLCLRARKRGRESGLDGNITTADLYWPTFCPILGIRLDYDTPRGQRAANNPAAPSLDRWDNSKGYEPGNVYVISLRANLIKGDATAEELQAVANYAKRGIW